MHAARYSTQFLFDPALDVLVDRLATETTN